MWAFGNMVNELSIDAFKDAGFVPLTDDEFDTFLKEAVFEKLKGKKLGQIFSEKYNIRDRVLSIYSDDQDVIKHIRYCNYVK